LKVTNGVLKVVATGMNNNSRHAEVDVIKKYKKCAINNKNGNRKLRLIVWRIAADGTISNSKPCWSCICAMNKSQLQLHEIMYSEKIASRTHLVRTSINALLTDKSPHIGRY
jgi:hypothetical protein